MKILGKSSENEMIALFLKGELTSKRFSKELLKIISDFNVNLNTISIYDLNNKTDNDLRKLVLRLYRGYGDNKEIFTNFPTEIDWYWCRLEREDIQKIKYIDYDYWTELTNGTRYTIDSKENILNGKEIFGVSNKPFVEGANFLKKGGVFPPIIVLAANDSNDEMIVLEGHSRLASISLVIDYIKSIDALIGFVKKEELYKWNQY